MINSKKDTRIFQKGMLCFLISFLLLFTGCSAENGAGKISDGEITAQQKTATQETKTQKQTESESQSLADDTSDAASTEQESTTDNLIEATTTTEVVTTISETITEIETATETQQAEMLVSAPAFDVSTVPAYNGNAWVFINEGTPFFTDEYLTDTSYEYYSVLDNLGRCGVCVANIGADIMPTEERGSIGDIKPSGWNQAKYSGLVDGNYLYNRCHLIGYQLTGENANEKNLITGTRYLNIEGMLPFENMIADYVKETDNHVLLRVTPVFEGDNPLASGVLMEGKSVEDNGEGVLFCVYCYNVQPNIHIDYADGSSYLIEPETTTEVVTIQEETTQQVDTQPETTQEVTTQEPTTSSSGETCWKSATGSKYHSINNCGRMDPDKATLITIEEAERLGLERCSKCY